MGSLLVTFAANAQSDTIFLEAEQGIREAGWVDTAMPLASDSTAIISFDGKTGVPGSTVKYYFEVTQRDAFDFSVRMNSISNIDDSFFYKVNHKGSWNTCNNNGAKSLEWVKFSTDTLEAGWNALQIASRENAILDKFVVSNEPGYVSSLTNEIGDTAVNIDGPLIPSDPNGIWLEAEYGVKQGSWSLYESPVASNDTMLTPGNPATSNTPNSSIRYYFNVDQRTQYKVWLRIEKGKRGGFFFRMNGEGDWIKKNDFASTDDLQWYYGGTGFKDTLEVGLNYIELGSREVLYTDKILITSSQSFVPVGKGDSARNLTGSLAPPAAPEAITYEYQNDSVVKISWTAGSGDKEGFIIERSTNDTTYVLVDTVKGNESFVLDTVNMPASMMHFYTVKAYNIFGNSSGNDTINIDYVIPTLDSTNPAEGTIDVATTLNTITFYFNGQVVLSDASKIQIIGSKSNVFDTVAYFPGIAGDTALVLALSKDLSLTKATYTVRIPMNTLTNISGFALDSTGGSFTTIASNDTSLSDLTVGGITVAGFNPLTQFYDIELAEGADTTVAATASDTNATVLITQASAIPGNAMVKVIAENEMDSAIYIINFTLEAPVNVDVANAKDLAIFPVPADDHIFINGAAGSNISIINMSGEIVVTANNISESQVIDVSALKGVYFVTLDNDKIAQKIIVK